jgi:hypothetical protein
MSYDHPVSGHFGDNLLPEDCGLTNAISIIIIILYIYINRILESENRLQTCCLVGHVSLSCFTHAIWMKQCALLVITHAWLAGNFSI